MKRIKRVAAAVGVSSMLAFGVAGKAEACEWFPGGEPGTIFICPLPPDPVSGFVVGTVAVVMHELVADKPFSNKGEIAKIATTVRNDIGKKTGLQKATRWLRKKTGIKW